MTSPCGNRAWLNSRMSDRPFVMPQSISPVRCRRWASITGHRFLDDAEARANSPSTRVALERSQASLAQRDAIRPVYPLETAIGIAAAGVAGGAAAADRAAAGAVTRQFLPERPASAAQESVAPPVAPKPETTSDIVAPTRRPVGIVLGRTRSAIRTVTPGEFQTIEHRLLQGATKIRRPSYDGVWRERPNGTGFGIRNNSESGPTIDVPDSNLPKDFNVHQR